MEINKSILIMDTPLRCDLCDIIQWDCDNKYYFCGKQFENGDGFKKVNNDTFERPDWCPLKDGVVDNFKVNPLSEKIKVTGAQLIHDANAKGFKPEFANGYVNGWNSCIDDIEGNKIIDINFKFEEYEYKNFKLLDSHLPEDSYDFSRLDMGLYTDFIGRKYSIEFYHYFDEDRFYWVACRDNYSIYNTRIDPNEYEKAKSYMKMKEKEKGF